MKPATARTLASIAVLAGFLPMAFLHLVFLWVVRIPHTAFKPGGPSWPLLTLSAATAFFSLLPLLLLAPALFSLLRGAYPSLRRGLKAWLFPPALLLALLVPCAWPFALLAPATRRLGGRSACALALSGGIAGLLPTLSVLLVHLSSNPLPFSPHYPALLLSALSTALLLAALAKTAPSRRATRALSIAFALLVLLSLATQPVFLRPAFRAEADAALAALIDATGTALRPDAPYPDAIPPVPPDADPIAALDLDTIREQGTRLAEVTASLSARWTTNRPLCRLHPFTSEEIARVADALDAVPDLRAAAEAFSAPGYRSSLPGGTTPGDGTLLEPELESSVLHYAHFLAWRAAIAARNDDLPALRADLERLANCAAIAAREPFLIGPLLASAILKFPFVSSAIQSTLPLLPDDALVDLPDAAVSLSALIDSHCGDSIACESFFIARYILGEYWIADLSSILGVRNPTIALLSFFPPSWRECLALSAQTDIYHYCTALAADLLPALALPPNAASAAFQAALQRAEARLETLPVFAAVVAIEPKFLLEGLLAPRDIATFLRTAVAIERHRRARGTLPATLDALVPDFLPALPLESFTGAPLAYQPGPIDLPEETLRSSPPEAPVVLPPVTLPGYLLSLPSSRPDRPPSPLFFPTP